MSDREVTEFDLRADEYKRRDVKPEDYEFRADGKIARKDRWETGIRNIASNAPGIGSRANFEIPDVVAAAKRAFNAQEALDGLYQKLVAEQQRLAGLMEEEETLPPSEVIGGKAAGITAAIRLLTEQAAEHGYMLGGADDKDA